MKIFIAAAALTAALSGICALIHRKCGQHCRQGLPFEEEIEKPEGLSMRVVKESLTPGSVSIEILNSTDTDIESGSAEDFTLNVERDGCWYCIDCGGKKENTAVYGFLQDTPLRLELNWGKDCGELKPGHYRIVKNFYEYRGGDYRPFLMAAEFTVA